ncbi:sulfotransferase family 2 domain-containing protein [Allochromatium warmingii]|uniref:sulfotransferase family 2 domain-containing protein n=1 Tax=Allochromatium warmingii TaxID=61595 RepID=UPI0015A61169|nr:sulfotransferase family 2 domain-containing protein [Allochromatium warmingii]
MSNCKKNCARIKSGKIFPKIIKYRVISIIRDPLQRFISSYNFIRTLSVRGDEWSKSLLEKHNAHSICSLEDLFHSSLWTGSVDGNLDKADELQKFFVPQYRFIETTNDAIAKNISIFQLEHFQEAKNNLIQLGILGQTDQLEHMNKSQRFLESDDIEQELLPVIRDRYERDFQLHGQLNKEWI